MLMFLKNKKVDNLKEKKKQIAANSSTIQLIN